jgi:hypothetical protein
MDAWQRFAMEKAVAENLRNAIENGYESVLVDSPEAVAVDLCLCSADFDGLTPAEFDGLKETIAAWQAKQKN